MATRKNGKRTTTTGPLQAVGYVRISVDRDDQTSTDTQERSIRAFCESQGWPLVDLIVERGRSAYKDTRGARPGFHKAVHLVHVGAAQVLVAWKLDRVSRNARDLHNFVHDLEEHGGYFACAGDTAINTTTGSGKLQLSIMAAIAEMESDIKSDRIFEWHEDRRRNLAPPVGPTPYGYDRNEANLLTINSAEAAVIREAATALLAGDSVREVVRRLGEAGVRTKPTPSKPHGLPFERRTVKLALVKPVVAGLCEVEDGEFVQSGQWAPILDRRTWDELRALLLDPARKDGPGNRPRWLMSGIARCGRCSDEERPLYVKPRGKGGISRYTCHGCGMSIETGKTDEYVTKMLLGALDQRAWRRLRTRSVTTAGDTDEGYDIAFDALTAQLKADEIDAVEFVQLHDRLKRQRDAAKDPPPALPDVDDVRKAWETDRLTIDQQRLVLAAAAEVTILPATKGRNWWDDDRVQFATSL